MAEGRRRKPKAPPAAPRSRAPAKPRRPRRSPSPRRPSRPPTPSSRRACRGASASASRCVRAFLKKQEGVTEDFFYYGPRTGWAYRYLRDARASRCARSLIHAERLVGIVALDAGAQPPSSSGTTCRRSRQRPRKLAHGTPALLWLDVPSTAPAPPTSRRCSRPSSTTLPPPCPSRHGAATVERRQQADRPHSNSESRGNSSAPAERQPPTRHAVRASRHMHLC